MKHLVCSFLLFLISFSLFSQEKKGEFAEHIIVGTGAGLQINAGNENPDLKHSEFTWISNTSISLSKRIHLGAEYRYMQLRGSTINFEPDSYDTYMFGLFTQYDILDFDRFRLFGQLNINTGNYCACEKFRDPFLVKNTHHLGWGAGINYRVWKDFSFDFSLVYDYTLNKRNFDPYVYTYWALGFNYDLYRKLK